MTCHCLTAPRRKNSQRTGAALALIAIFLPVMVILSGFAINVAYMELSRSELRVATDAAARAGGRVLAMTGDKNLAISAIRDYASRNTVAGAPLQISDKEIVFGQAERPSIVDRYVFVAGKKPYNSLRIQGRRTSDSLGGAVNLFLPRVMSVSTFEPVQSATVTQVELDVAVLLDRSGSMAYAPNESSGSGSPPASAPASWDYGDEVPTGSRWLDAVAGVTVFLNTLEQTPQKEQVALVTYNGDATIDVNLTDDYFDFASAMNVYSASFDGGKTNIGGAIQLGEQSLFDTMHERPWATKAIVVLTDGQHNTGTKPDVAAEVVSQKGIAVYTITFSDEAAQGEMQEVADVGGGTHVHASTGAELEDAFRQIAKSLPTLLTD